MSADATERANAYLQNALKKSYDQALKDHIADYQNYFNRVSLDLGVTDSVKNPTDMRLEQFAKWKRSATGCHSIFSLGVIC